ncbi:FAD-binding oxidoreductase [Vibrio sp. S9_S30]|uniref:styrene monooxygenase/indole monooxygenase family protein n=1 Tax=Vibrio sp. S9_S30 TaxID=2720226 RepID=UPI0016809F44|nr:styrene monooxygenase/indole monooxygenase family protein [Vibrio sp. S9_S30]MBD1558144.1 FAD-binding oxidoreductase [Vibrio sp. S9_S30]
MRSIAIVGGGQAGLPLAIRLLDNDYRVTVVTNRTPDSIREGSVLSSQCMFDDALQIERDSGLNLWETNCPNVDGIGFSVPHPEMAGEKAINWSATLDKPAQAVDQRVKMPIWMELFESKGGNLVIEDVGIPELENLTSTHDLVLLAAGKGDVVRLFERDETRSAFSKPQRALALTYVNGMKEQDDFSQVAFNLIPGVGEYFTFPAFTTSGPCDIMVFEGIPGGPMDCWNDIRTPQDHLATSNKILETFLPWEAERCQHVELTDENGILAGRFPPTVRKPVMTLPSGRLVFGMGDAVATNDPITGQGSNNATKAAKIYGDAILAHGDQRFTADWMNQTFDTFWEYASDVVSWTNSLLLPPPPHILELLASAQEIPSLASTIVNGFNHPPNFYPWWEDANLCKHFIESHSAKSA